MAAAGATLKVVDVEQRSLTVLSGVTDPEGTRRIIGREFIRVFEQAAREVIEEAGARGGSVVSLVQGTLYPDVVESGGGSGTANRLEILLANVRSEGVQGDGRTYGHPIVLRPASSEDAMTADWTRLPDEVLARISTRITNEVPEINRVVLDATSKPPGTIEWE